MRRVRFAAAGALLGAAAAGGWPARDARGQGAAATPPAPPAAAASRRAGTGEFWFDPTQLPSFTGTVERYLLNPRGETDALLFREGPQVVFPPDVADAVRQAAAPGRPIVVWGIRARSAPVITMLAFAPSADASPVVVERLYWRLFGRNPEERTERLSAAGTVKQPYYSPQGELAGAVLEDGTVVLVPQGAAAASDEVRTLLRAGAKLAAEGYGATAAATAAGQGAPPPGTAPRALLADRMGEDAGSLRPVPSPAAQGQAPAPSR